MLSFMLLDLTLTDVLKSLPSDLGSVFALLLALLFVGLTLWGGSRKKVKTPAEPADEAPEHRHAPM